MIPELDLTPGTLALRRVSGVAGVSDDVALSVLSGLVCSGTWKGSWAALIVWWLCWRSFRLGRIYQKGSVPRSLCPKTCLFKLGLCVPRDKCLISVCISSRDPPFISPLVKHLLKLKNRLKKISKLLPAGFEDKINHHFRENQRQAVKRESCMSGRGSRARWSTVPLHVVIHFLSKVKRTACGPDELPYWLFRDFAHDLAPAVTYVFNGSLRQHKVPFSWKMADTKPLPKEVPLTSCTQLRPISLTAVIMRLFEHLVYRFELSSICKDDIDLDRFVYCGGHNSTMALIKCQHTWLKWLDGCNDFVRIFSYDFRKS